MSFIYKLALWLFLKIPIPDFNYLDDCIFSLGLILSLRILNLYLITMKL